MTFTFQSKHGDREWVVTAGEINCSGYPDWSYFETDNGMNFGDRGTLPNGTRVSDLQEMLGEAVGMEVWEA